MGKIIRPGCDMREFKPLELADKDMIDGYIHSDPPQISEMTFTNLFMWRRHFRTEWAEVEGCLAVLMKPEHQPPFGLAPVGRGNKSGALDFIFNRLAGATDRPSVQRAGRDFVDRFADGKKYRTAPQPEQSDYVYRTKDLIELAGRKHHQKKNHLNQFLKQYEFETREIDAETAGAAIELQEAWCKVRECALDPSLMSEDRATYEVLTHFTDLDCKGLAVIIDGKVQAFAIGEPLNPEMAVIHLEKANPEVRGLYVAVNQMFCQRFWSEYEYVNREQDLGVEGLRQAKLSFHPDHMVDKFAIFRK